MKCWLKVWEGNFRLSLNLKVWPNFHESWDLDAIWKSFSCIFMEIELTKFSKLLIWKRLGAKWQPLISPEFKWIMLNVLFIWFDLGMLDLYPHLSLLAGLFSRINRNLLVACNSLKKFESRLYRTLKPRSFRRNSHRTYCYSNMKFILYIQGILSNRYYLFYGR